VLKSLSRHELDNIIRDLELLRTQALQISEAMGLKYEEALMLLILREAVILQKKLDQLLQR